MSLTKDPTHNTEVELATETGTIKFRAEADRALFLQRGYPPKDYGLFFRVYPTEADRERYMRQLREQDEEEKRRYPFSVETDAGVIEFKTEADRDYFLEDFPTPEDKAQYVRSLRRMRAVDQEGEALEAFVSKKRNREAALKFLRKLTLRLAGFSEVGSFWRYLNFAIVSGRMAPP